ncbi:MAG: hypothetical protein ACFFBD_18520, partial [Candidatus Hodarchaeota archaeon]
NLAITERNYQIFESIFLRTGFNDLNYLRLARKWLEKIFLANQNKKIYSESMFSNILANYWFFACYSSQNLGLLVWKEYYQSSLVKYDITPMHLKLKLVLLFLIHSFLNY